ncbi:tyrosine-type recombinase/integrase [Paenibacillus algorifonticola]|uniref:tyrosine-type recombinase/integrase n=1 Tax=Paenibacillus algorifonticola TaxID=684063 RepID=UPI003D27EB0B
MTTNGDISELTTYSLNDAFIVFYNAKQAEALRGQTLRNYRSHWAYFCDWLRIEHASIQYINEITSVLLRQYINYMHNKIKFSDIPHRLVKGSKISTHTVISRIQTMKTMFIFWTNERMITVNPVKTIKKPRVDVDERQTFTDNDVRKLLAAPDITTHAGFRDRTVMLLLVDGGFRINEALRINTDLIDHETCSIYLPASMNKNRKSRRVPISPETLAEIDKLIEINREHYESDYLFIAKNGLPLKIDHFRKRLREHTAKAGVDPKLSRPHQFRIYFCTMYLLNGGDIMTLQRIVAHADIETTRSYSRADDEHIRKQHAKFSPLTRLK